VVYRECKAPIGITKLTEDFKCTVRLWLKIAEFDILFKPKSGTVVSAADAFRRQLPFSTNIYRYYQKKWDVTVKYEKYQKRNKWGLKRSRTWQVMLQEVWSAVRACLIYIRHNIITTKMGKKMTLIKTTAPKQTWGVNN
jgi:hypothetical protein